MVIHSSPGSRKRKKILPVEEKEIVTSKIPEKKVVIKKEVVEETPVIVEDPTAEEFIATLPKKQNRKKVTKIIEE